MRTHPIRLGMVGGGEGAFIGAVHRIAARMDGLFVLVAGALSADAARARRSGTALGLAAERIYTDYRDMARREAAREDGIEAVVIVTPNHLHAPVASAFLKSGIHVICDKPLSATLEEAEGLAALSEQQDRLLAVTYNYSAYPMVRLMRQMIGDGEIGAVRHIHGEYMQDWLTTPLEAHGQKQALWRTDPAQAGMGGALGDIGVHVFQLAEFTSKLEVSSLLATLGHSREARVLDDNASVLARWSNGANGTLLVSQTAPGNANGLRLRIHGEKGGLEWQQEQPDILHFAPYGEPARRIIRGGGGFPECLAGLTRLPPGHPEGYLEAFANLYSMIATALKRWDSGDRPTETELPTVKTGWRGLRFIAACVDSHRKGAVWRDV